MKIRCGYADTAVGQLHYAASGAGPVVVLLPHSGRSWRMYRHLMLRLAEAHRVIAIDVPGTGGSVALPERFGIPELGDVLVAALDDLGIDRFALYGMNGGNKLGSAIAAHHPDRVRAYVHAGLTHSIMLSNQGRNDVLGAHRSVGRVLEAAGLGTIPEDWLTRLQELVDVHPDPDEAAGLAVERLQSMRDRPAFYAATLAYDMESAMRSIKVPMLVLEFVTPREEQSLGRQGESVAAATGAQESVAMQLDDDEDVALEDRAEELYAVIASFVDSFPN